MLFVAILQAFAVIFTMTALWRDTLMISPEENGVTCNITTGYPPLKHFNVSAQHLIVYWGWHSLLVRWDVEGHLDTQIWLRETYRKTYDYRCTGESLSIRPTVAPTLTPHPTRLSLSHDSASHTAVHNISSSASLSSVSNTSNINQRKLLRSDNDNAISFEVPVSLQYESVLSSRHLLPSIFYPLPPLQMVDTYGTATSSYVYPFVITQTYPAPNNNSAAAIDINTTTLAPNSTSNGCEDLQIVIDTGKSYFSLLLCAVLCESLALILLVPPCCYLVSIARIRVLKRVVILMNTFSFMLLLMAFAIWFAYFSTNINQVIEQGTSENDFSVCILGAPQIGDSIVWLLSAWLLIGVSTMASCYCSNQPKQWYRFVRYKRNTYRARNVDHSCSDLNVDEVIEEESSASSEIESDVDAAQDDIDDIDDDDDAMDYNRMEDQHEISESDSREKHRLDTLMRSAASHGSIGSNDTYMTADAPASTFSPLN